MDDDHSMLPPVPGNTPSAHRVWACALSAAGLYARLSSMNRTLAFAVSAAALALMLAACTSAPSTAPTVEAVEPSAAPVDVEADHVTANSDACKGKAWIYTSSVHMNAKLRGKLQDLGPRKFADGIIGRDDEGDIVSYTVAAGDAPYAIGDRLCIENPLAMTHLNHTRTIQPGQVLQLSPDFEVPWVPYISPPEAPGGFQQIPYQHGIEAMSAAADAGDVDAMRAIWADELAAMFANPDDRDVIAQVLDAGDLDALRQMFS
ncbi:hypothetical protein [Microbacterium aerolatum]|uniref:hypothetical protein n=1 Tax=Microbacterium aerolatum TaxID=153731 RepID=UPI00384E8DF9